MSRPRTTSSLLARLLVAGTSALVALTLSSSAALGAGDDYAPTLKAAPYASTTDAYGLPNRSCGSFVAHRLKQAGVSIEDPRLLMLLDGVPYTDVRQRAAAVGVHVDQNPQVGAIMFWEPSGEIFGPDSVNEYDSFIGFAGPSGHVGYIAALNPDGSALVEHYNYTSGGGSSGVYSTLSVYGEPGLVIHVPQSLPPIAPPAPAPAPVPAPLPNPGIDRIPVDKPLSPLKIKRTLRLPARGVAIAQARKIGGTKRVGLGRKAVKKGSNALAWDRSAAVGKGRWQLVISYRGANGAKKVYRSGFTVG